MGLKLERRTAQIGSSINTRTQMHGDEHVTALDIPIVKVCLSDEELGQVLLNSRAYKLLYSKTKNRPDEPTFGKVLGAMPFRGKIKAVSVDIFLGRRVLRIPDGTLTKVKIEPTSGGTTWLQFTVQCVPDLDDNHPIIEALLSKLSEPIDIAIECEGYGAQPELPLEEPEDPEAGEEGEETEPGAEAEPEMSNLGKRISRGTRGKKS